MTVDHSKECFKVYNPLDNIIKKNLEKNNLKENMKDYKSLLRIFFNENKNINLHNFKEKPIEIYNNRKYKFL